MGVLLIHLTKRATTLTTILGEGHLRAMRAYGAAYNVDSLAPSQAAACFSEMGALESVARLAERHGDFGLGFAKRWLQNQGAAPVWYLPRDSRVQTEFFSTVRQLAFRETPDPAHPLWRITPFIDYPRDADPDSGKTHYDWRWEREWRACGGVRFEADDVAIVFAPEDQHDSITNWWLEIMCGGWDGAMPPLVDTRWHRDRQAEVIRLGPRRVQYQEPKLSPPGTDGGDSPFGPDEAWDSHEDYDDAESIETLESEYQRAEHRQELIGWLDEMERDDI